MKLNLRILKAPMLLVGLAALSLSACAQDRTADQSMHGDSGKRMGMTEMMSGDSGMRMGGMSGNPEDQKNMMQMMQQMSRMAETCNAMMEKHMGAGESQGQSPQGQH